jgi:hypothetical protein
VSNPSDKLKERLKKLLHNLVALKYINATVAERSLAQYLNIIKEDLTKNLDIFKQFDPSKSV